MTICLFGTPIVSDVSVSYAPALSGGSFSLSLPLTNLQDRRTSHVARTTDATTGSTTFDIDLGRACAVRVVSLLIPNLTKSAVPTIQWKGSTVSDFASTVYNPGAVQAWPTGVTAEDVTGPDGSEMHVWLTTVPAAAQTARYWRCAVVDTANVDGYLDFARLIIAEGFQPSHQFSVGALTGHESRSLAEDTDGGTTLYQPKPRKRIDRFALDDLTESECLANIRKMQRRLGTTGQFFWVRDTADTALMYEMAYAAVLRELSPLSYAVGSYMNAQFSIGEDL